MTDIYRLTLEEGPAGIAIARVEGEIDLASAARLGAELESAMRDGGAVLDLTGVAFIDSAGVRMLVELAASHRRGPVPVIAPEGSTARRMIALTAIEGLFQLHESGDTLVPAAGGS
jgi:anti-anti-sigma factor